MKRYIAIAALGLGLTLIAAMAAPGLLPSERLRVDAIAALRAETGIEPGVGGEVTLALLPWPSASLSDVSIEASESARLTIPRVHVALELLPLLTGRFVAGRIDLVRPHLALSEVQPVLPALPDLMVNGSGRARFRVIDGSILATGRDSLAVQIAKINGSIDWRAGRDFAANGSFVWLGVPLDFALDIDDMAALGRGERSDMLLTLAGEPVDFAFQGEAVLGADPAADGNLRVSTASLRRSLDWIGYPAPTKDGFGAFALRSKVEASSDGAALSEMRADIDGNRSEGGLTVKIERGRLLLQGTFASDAIDLSPYGKLALSEPSGNVWSRQPIDLEPLATLDADLRFSATKARVGDTTVQHMAASAVLKGGKLTLAVGDAEAWGGSFQASATLAPMAGSGGADVRVQLAGTDVALGPALGDLFRLTRLDGTGAFEIALGGAGGSVADIMSHLGGSVSVTAEKGAVLGVDVPRILSRLERRPLSGSGAIRGGRTDFDTLDAQAVVAGGVAKIDLLTLDSASVRIEVNGLVSIAERDLDLAGTASLVRPASANGATPAAGFDLPFVVQGSWESPLLLPDPQALIRRSGAARPLLGVAHEPDAASAAAPVPTGARVPRQPLIPAQ